MYKECLIDLKIQARGKKRKEENHCRWWLQPWNRKTLTPWKESYDQPRSHIQKQRHYFANKVCLVKAMVFPVVMYGCESWTIMKAECWRIDAFELWLEKTLESPLDCKKIQPVHPKGDQSWVFIGRTDLKLKLQYFGHLMRRVDSLEKTLMLGRIGGRRSGRQRRWLDGITDLMGVSLSELRELVMDRRPGVLRFMGLQRVGHDWATELNWTE